MYRRNLRLGAAVAAPARALPADAAIRPTYGGGRSAPYGRLRGGRMVDARYEMFVAPDTAKVAPQGGELVDVPRLNP